MLGRPQPWICVGTPALTPPAPLSPPARSVAVPAMIAFVSAGDGVPTPPPCFWRYHSRTSAAMPETAGAASEVDEFSV